MHILIADDDNVSRMILEAQLTRMNHTVVVTKDGQELVDVFKQMPDAYDVIITDIMMIKMNGLEAAREIKKIKNINIIALTAYEQETKIVDNAGQYIPWSTCNYFIRKPTQSECIREVLMNIDYDNYIRAKNK